MISKSVDKNQRGIDVVFNVTQNLYWLTSAGLLNYNVIVINQ